MSGHCPVCGECWPMTPAPSPDDRPRYTLAEHPRRVALTMNMASFDWKEAVVRCPGSGRTI